MMGTPKVLVANRGEIAIRIFRSASELGWQTVALYTEKDESHAHYADEAILLDSPTRYMDAEYIADIVRSTGCSHVHPGYGFLSESPKFASLFPHSSTPDTGGPVFVGPTIKTLEIASDKMRSRELAESLGISVASGTHVSSTADVYRFAEQLGGSPYPIILKALDGGGGRGIRLVQFAGEIEDAFKRCMGESPSKQIFVEKALVGPKWKHIEVQIVGDGRGNVTHLWERECSVQRRFQKIVETAPSTLERSSVEPLLNAALKMARHLRYAGLGTFEFLIHTSTQEWVFLEINPRIQVEHTITEEITGVDLVRTQLLLSMPGASLGDILPRQPSPTGRAIQLRLVAENPHNSFRLSPGDITPSSLSWPNGRGVRVDTWLSVGPHAPEEDNVWTVGVDFDSLLAKIIVHGETFQEATAKALRAIREVRIPKTMKTNAALLAGIVAHPEWSRGTIHTQWLESNAESILRSGEEQMRSKISRSVTSKVISQGHSSTNAQGSSGSIILQPGTAFQLSLSTPGPGSEEQMQKHSVVLSTIGHNAFPENLSGTITTSLSPTPLAFSLTQLSMLLTSSQVEFANPQDVTHLSCPLAGKIVELHPALDSSASGESIREGEPLVVVSVMKMESVVNAPRSGRVVRVGRGIEAGAIMPEGTLICVLEEHSRPLPSRLARVAKL